MMRKKRLLSRLRRRMSSSSISDLTVTERTRDGYAATLFRAWRAVSEARVSCFIVNAVSQVVAHFGNGRRSCATCR